MRNYPNGFRLKLEDYRHTTDEIGELPICGVINANFWRISSSVQVTTIGIPVFFRTKVSPSIALKTAVNRQGFLPLAPLFFKKLLVY